MYFANNTNMYFNYHAKVKQLIKDNQVVFYKFFDKWNNISPALVIFFKSHIPMPIRQNKWDEYLKILPDDKLSNS